MLLSIILCDLRAGTTYGVFDDDDGASAVGCLTAARLAVSVLDDDDDGEVKASNCLANWPTLLVFFTAAGLAAFVAAGGIIAVSLSFTAAGLAGSVFDDNVTAGMIAVFGLGAGAGGASIVDDGDCSLAAVLVFLLI